MDRWDTAGLRKTEDKELGKKSKQQRRVNLNGGKHS